MTDELDEPLGRKKKRKPSLAGLRGHKQGLRDWPIARISFGLAALIVAVAVLRVALVHDPNGGRPSATVDISNTRDTNAVAHQVASGDEQKSPSVGATQSPSIVAAPAIQGNGDGPQITTLDASTPDTADAGTPVAVASLNAFGVEPDLVEETTNGPIPHVGPKGRTPFQAYARASISPKSADGHPLIAIVVTGLGLNESVTLDAISKLPDNVTLAFAPYGKTLQRTTAAARAEGHEMLLQIPLEPFDYPESDPGPKTLLTGQPPRANLDKLYWLMSRFGGYFGLTNYMGARFTSSAADFEPIMEEMGTRGLGYLSDGSSNRSLAPQLAARNKVPFARANLELDTSPDRGAILQKLDELEADARDKGSAIGIISALPISIKTVADWAAGLDDKGIMLVPTSALMKTD